MAAHQARQGVFAIVAKSHACQRLGLLRRNHFHEGAVVGLCQHRRSKTNNLEILGNPYPTAGNRQTIGSKGNGTAIILVADKRHISPQKITVIQVRIGKGPVLIVVDGEGRTAPRYAHAHAVVATIEK